MENILQYEILLEKSEKFNIWNILLNLSCLTLQLKIEMESVDEKPHSDKKCALKFKIFIYRYWQH